MPVLFAGFAPGPLLVTDVSVVDVERAVATPGQSVLVRDGVIEAVGPTVARPAGVRVVDGTGLFAMPGLFDAHVHLNSPEREARLLVANGVLFARDLGGPTDERLAVRDTGTVALRAVFATVTAHDAAGNNIHTAPDYPVFAMSDDEVGIPRAVSSQPRRAAATCRRRSGGPPAAKEAVEVTRDMEAEY